ncbi:TonB-dependent receptor [Pedobacter sp. L105]|uniref:SusC/RagA family TonB-linked outer membrane protein n=1 Tax=Pedobacter sp. L105 TaxID=1641871 RepID=UPI00131E7E79|nr:TonB-dependent receptor [Pedobacter sp. L105]
MQKITTSYWWRFSALFLLLFTSQTLFSQQNHNVSGTVTGKDDGLPIPGANVVVKNGKGGTSTDQNGKFTLNVSFGAQLIFKAVGYEDQEISASVTVINIKLVSQQNNLNELVVIGYGTVQKKDLTGAVAGIKGGDIKSQGVSDITRSLQGKMPGVTIESAGGDPGSGTRILIRGVGTLGNAAPLYIVDGVQVAGINNLSSGDIESIDVLKDASAAAIYGSRAANGVVIVTTKSGKSGAPVVQLNVNGGVQHVAKKLDVLNAEQWATVSNAAHTAAGLPTLDIAANPASLGAGTNWQDAIFRTAAVQQYDLSISGGSESTKYSVSGGYTDQDGIVKVTGYNRYNLRARSETTKGKFKFGETILLSREKTVTMPSGWGGQGGNAVGSSTKMIPVFQINDPAAVGGFGGAYGPVVNIPNPIAMLYLESIDKITTSALLNAYGEYIILPGLKYRLNVGYTQVENTGNDYDRRYAVGTLFSHPTNDISIYKDQNTLLLLENTLNYDKKIGKSSIQALAGYTFQRNSYNYLSAARTDLPDGIQAIDAGAGISTNTGNSTESDLVSFLGRAIYSYDDKYLLTASFRRDGSSRFASSNRYGDFPSVALGWNISNEKFFEPLLNTISSLKLRASYGVLGNQEIGDYQYSASIASNVNYVSGTTQQKWYGAIQTAYASPFIKWENTQTLNWGMDIGFFNNKLGVTADYFIKKTNDVLLNVPIPGSAGAVSDPVVNAGKLQNKGVELGLNYSNKIGKLSYSVFGTLSSIKNKVLQLGSGSQQIYGGQPTHHGATTTVTEEGGPISAFYLIKAIGIFNSQAEINAYKKNGVLIQPNASPGDIKFLDANGDGQINDQDKVYSGSPFPKFEYGGGFNASIFNFDISAFFQGTQGNKIYNGNRQDLESMSLEFNYAATTLNAWTPANHTDFPRAVINDPNFNDRTSTRFLESGSYLRLKTLQLGYKLQEKVCKKIGVSALRAYVSADNLFTVTDYTGYNPDIGRSGSIFDRGVDFGEVSYPLAKTISIGLQVTF